MTPENPPAFPSQAYGEDGRPESEAVSGMSLRDYFAGQALVSFGKHDIYQDKHIAFRAYRLADDMLAERAKVRP